MTESIVKRLVLCLLVAAVLPLNVSSQTPSTFISPPSSGGGGITPSKTAGAGTPPSAANSPDNAPTKENIDKNK